MFPARARGELEFLISPWPGNCSDRTMDRTMEIVPGALCICPWPTEGRRVLMSASLVLELRARAIEGFVSLPKRGVEIGGILFGHARADSVQIEGFEEAACEHRYGPSYALSDADRAQLSDLLAQ